MSSFQNLGIYVKDLIKFNTLIKRLNLVYVLVIRTIAINKPFIDT